MRPSVVGVHVALCVLFTFVSNAAGADNEDDLSAELINNIETLFNFVAVGSLVSKGDLKRAVKLSGTNLNQLWQRAGVGYSERLNWEQFKKLSVSVLKRCVTPAELALAFCIYDSDRDLRLTLQQFKDATYQLWSRTISDDEAKSMDLDGDGLISLTDFDAMHAIHKAIHIQIRDQN